MNEPQKTHVQWSRRPAEEDMPQKWDVLTVPPKGLGNLIVLSGDVIGAKVHYSRGRTVPCPGDGCEVCDTNVKPRWEGYLAVANHSLKELVIVRLTPASMGPIDKYFREHRSLRSAQLSLQRLGQKPNGKIRAFIEPSRYQAENLPKAPHMQKFLARMWGMTEVREATAQPPLILHDPPGREQDFGGESMEAG